MSSAEDAGHGEPGKPAARKYAGQDIPENMTKSAFKRLKKMERMAADRDEFLAKRKQKRREARKRNPTRRRLPSRSAERRPSGVTVVIDCGFDDYMTANERTSLAGQLTRCYSQNRRSLRPVELVISGFRGRLRDRFENEMHATHRLWSGVTFVDGDYGFGRGEKAGENAGKTAATNSERKPDQNSLAGKPEDHPTTETANQTGDQLANADPAADPAAKSTEGSAQSATKPEAELANAVYLTGDAEDVLYELEPGATYFVGGIVDKNRYTNLCLNKAKQGGIRTARLPIDEHIKVSGRRVLTTNQAFELLLRWLELRDWKAAFEAAIPSRKLVGEDGELGGVTDENTAEQSGGESDSASDSDSASESEQTPA